jgi:hypothetical protein
MEANSSADFAEWDVENFRLTVFHTSDSNISGLWERLMGVSPESIDSRPRERVLREQGGANGNNLLLVTQAGRLDWHLQPDPAPDHPIGTPPSLKAVNQTLPLLRRALDVTLQSVNQVLRLAFGVVLIQQVSGLNEGMRHLSKYLPHMGLENQEGLDFVYQINRRRRSANSLHVQINRLAKWQLEQFHSGALRITPTQGARLETSDSGFVCKLVLDINTAAENNAISKDRMPVLSVELTALAREIAVKGDIP